MKTQDAITILQDMFPEFYVCDETRENQTI